MPSFLLASSAIASFTFMLSPVPEPVWETSRTILSSSSPLASLIAASIIASAMSGSSRPSSLLAFAAAYLMSPMASMISLGNLSPVKLYSFTAFSV